jgi:hypothetical protein
VNAVTRGGQLLARNTCTAVSTAVEFAGKIFEVASSSDSDVTFCVIVIKLLSFYIQQISGSDGPVGNLDLLG